MLECNHRTKVIAEKYFNSDIIITDPCYIIPDAKTDDWQKSRHSDYMLCLEFRHYLCEATLIGDWYCEVFTGTGSRLWYPQAPEREIGDFSADACKLGVFYLREILQYNPSSNDHIKQPRCACWIKNFQKTVKIVTGLDPMAMKVCMLLAMATNHFSAEKHIGVRFFHMITDFSVIFL